MTRELVMCRTNSLNLIDVSSIKKIIMIYCVDDINCDSFAGTIARKHIHALGTSFAIISFEIVNLHCVKFVIFESLNL